MIVDLKNKLPEELENLSAADFVMVQEGEQIMDEKFQTKPIGFFKDAMIRLSKSSVAVISFTLIVLIILSALIVPLLTGYGYNEQNVNCKNMPPKIQGLEKLGIADGTRVMKNRKMANLEDPNMYPNDCVIEIVREFEYKGVAMCDVVIDYYAFCGAAEDQYHWFGTDYLGRDLMTRLFRGTRVSLLIFYSAISLVTILIVDLSYGIIDPRIRVGGGNK